MRVFVVFVVCVLGVCTPHCRFFRVFIFLSRPNYINDACVLLTMPQCMLTATTFRTLIGAYVTVSDGQIIAIHPVGSAFATAVMNGQPTQAEEVASTALTDMAASQLILDS